MPDGTTVKVFAPRIHKSNAREVLDGAEDSIEYLLLRIMTLAVATPGRDLDSIEIVADAVREYMDEFGDATIRAFLARNIVDFPEDCEDDLE